MRAPGRLARGSEIEPRERLAGWQISASYLHCTVTSSTTLADHERAEAARALLTEQVEMLRKATDELSAWLDGPEISPEG